MVTLDEVIKLPEGQHRVTFEGRTTWTATLVHVDDDTHVLHYEGPSEQQSRDFTLAADADGNVVVPSKPAWGRLTKIGVTRDTVSSSEEGEEKITPEAVQAAQPEELPAELDLESDLREEELAEDAA